jgi:hypothetical protein
VASAVPKVPGSRRVAIGTAGSPVGLGAEVWAEAEISPHWHTSRTPGPSPWWTHSDIEALRVGLSASEWRRLSLCEWAEADDALTHRRTWRRASVPVRPLCLPAPVSIT